MEDDRPNRVELLVTLSDGTVWTIDAFETSSGTLGLTLTKNSLSLNLLQGDGAVVGQDQKVYDILQNEDGFVVC